jgi:hypothetical protein
MAGGAHAAGAALVSGGRIADQADGVDEVVVAVAEHRTGHAQAFASQRQPCLQVQALLRLSDRGGGHGGHADGGAGADLGDVGGAGRCIHLAGGRRAKAAAGLEP